MVAQNWLGYVVLKGSASVCGAVQAFVEERG